MPWRNLQLQNFRISLQQHEIFYDENHSKIALYWKVSEKAAYDGEYAEKLSFWMDCKSFFGCIFNSVLQKNIVEGKQSHSTKK